MVTVNRPFTPRFPYPPHFIKIFKLAERWRAGICFLANFAKLADAPS
jgi:hypothetical protein